MKKDIEWLKEKVEEMYTHYSISNNFDFVSKREAITEISNLIDQLDEPEQTDTNVGLSKPVIPDFMAYWIEENECLSLIYIGFKLFTNRIKDEDVNDWISNNQEQFCRAFLAWPNVGVEKEKKYHIKFSHNQYACRFNEEAINSTLVTKYEASEFTEAEIKAIDGRLMVFAQEVTE